MVPWRLFCSPLKLSAGASVPLTAVLGGLGALLGVASERYILRVTAAGCGQAFSAYWRGNAVREDPPQPEAGTLRRHPAWYLPCRQAARSERDIAFWTIPSTDGHHPTQLLCDVWQPPRSVTPWGLAFIFFHGGGWNEFHKDSLTRPVFRHLTGQGHFVMDVACRLHPAADLVGMVGDTKRAVAWMKANAERFGVNPDRIVVDGGSAGGYLVLPAAYTPGDPELTPACLEDLDTSVRAVIAFYAIVDLRSYFAYNDYTTLNLGLLELSSPWEVVASLVGGTPGQVPER
jgi:acetyl esterase/lipase